MMPERRKGERGRAAILSPIAFPRGGVVILRSWNILAAELPGMPETEFRHAVAMESPSIAAGLEMAPPGGSSRSQGR